MTETVTTLTATEIIALLALMLSLPTALGTAALIFILRSLLHIERRLGKLERRL
jgi:hypothetical protein